MTARYQTRPITPESEPSPSPTDSNKPPLARDNSRYPPPLPLKPLSTPRETETLPSQTSQNMSDRRYSSSAAAGSAADLRRRSTVGQNGQWAQQPSRRMSTSSRISRSQSFDQTGQHEESDSSASSLLVSIPLVVAIVPPLLSALTGNSAVWGDVLLFLFIAYYLQYLMRVPWDLYEASRSSRIDAATNIPSPASGESAATASARQAALAASVKELRRLELWNLLFVVTSPLIGGGGLWLAKRYLFSPNGPIGSQFNIGLFVFAAGIRPAVHVAELVKNRAIRLQKEIHIPYPEIDALNRKISALESELASVRATAVSRVGEIEGVQEAVHGVEKLRSVVKKLKETRGDQGLSLRDHELLMDLQNKVLDQEEILNALRSGELVVLSDRTEEPEPPAGLVGATVSLGGKIVKRSVELMLLPATISWSFARAVGISLLRGAVKKTMIEG